MNCVSRCVADRREAAHLSACGCRGRSPRLWPKRTHSPTESSDVMLEGSCFAGFRISSSIALSPKSLWWWRVFTDDCRLRGHSCRMATGAREARVGRGLGGQALAPKGIGDGTSILDGVYSADGDGKGQMFHPAPAPTQEEIEQLVERVSKRILRFLQRRGVITLVTAPGDGEVTVVADETLGNDDPLLARLLAAATAGCAHKQARCQ